MSTRSALLYSTDEDEDYFFTSTVERPQYKSSRSRNAVASIRQKCTFRSRSSSYTSLKDEKMYSDDLVTSPAKGPLLSENHSAFKKPAFLQQRKKEQTIATESDISSDNDEEQEFRSNESTPFGKKQSIYSRRPSGSQSSWKYSLKRAVGGLKTRGSSNTDA